MASYKAYHSLEVGDANGDIAVMRFPAFVADAALVSDLATSNGNYGTAIGAPGHLTNGKVIRRSVTLIFDEAQLSAGSPPIDAEFPSVADKARLSFANAKGTHLQVSLPAPIEAVFHAPPADDTVDPANAAMATFIAAVEANAFDVGGNALNLYGGGVRQKSRARRRKQHRL